ncbi:hypothetical protein HYN46_03055 [Aquirhabdus parva]|uniref:Uncharacterized protein n=1 Tax=Aquirhabdus parva TaxID=2283318 RepID=A0A345P3S8_9GAMM|nr:hypothetical protein HYN46_03055 [Aquirhabdus parva]
MSFGIKKRQKWRFFMGAEYINEAVFICVMLGIFWCLRGEGACAKRWINAIICLCCIYVVFNKSSIAFEYA